MKPIEAIVISGASGAGKSTVANLLEDSGYFVVDNLPPELFEKVLFLANTPRSEFTRFAFVVDARRPSLLKQFPLFFKTIQKQHKLKLIFLECNEQTLFNRFKETRRRHPFAHDTSLNEAIRLENEALEPLRVLADNRVDTSTFSARELKEFFRERFIDGYTESMRIALVSFGFKHGLPADLDTCFDARFLKNPYFDPKLRPLNGLNSAVSESVLSDPRAGAFVDRIVDMLTFLIPEYEKEGRAYFTLGIGCTGGQHRAPSLIEQVPKKLKIKGVRFRIEHRDILR